MMKWCNAVNSMPVAGPDKLPCGGWDAVIGQQAKADALAHVIRHAFEPPEPPDPKALAADAAEITAVLDDLISSYRKWIYSHDSAQEPG